MKNRVVFFNIFKDFCKYVLSFFVTFILIVFSFGFEINNTVCEKVIACNIDSVNCEQLVSRKSFFDIFKDIFNFEKDDKSSNKRKMQVYVGGYPLGFTLECEGVLIVSIGDVQTVYGNVCPAKDKNIKEGDILYSINGVIITSATHLHSLLNKTYQGEVDIVLKRGQTLIKEKITPVKEVSSDMYRLGFWIRDNAAGVGTLTYIRTDNNRFGALGHPVCDVDTGKLMPVSGGNIYRCNIIGYNKGQRGNPGELRGLFLRSGLKAGNIDNNNEYGVYGEIDESYKESLGEPVDVCFKDEVKTGKAKMLCTIDGLLPKEYDIEIVKLSHQTKSDKKSMVIKVTDKELISKTGGIVQGMSGSPILQNGKLVGAVTHVFVSDPTKGFGLYIDWMIDN